MNAKGWCCRLLRPPLLRCSRINHNEWCPKSCKQSLIQVTNHEAAVSQQTVTPVYARDGSGALVISNRAESHASNGGTSTHQWKASIFGYRNGSAIAQRCWGCLRYRSGTTGCNLATSTTRPALKDLAVQTWLCSAKPGF